MNPIFRNFLKFCILIAPAVLFVVSNTIFPFVVGKNFAFRILVEIIFACWIVLVITHRDYLPKQNAIITTFSFFLLITGIANFFGVDPQNSYWGNFERMDGFLNLLHLFGFFVVSSILVKEKIWKWLLISFISVAVFMSIDAISDFIVSNESGFRVASFLGNPTYLAGYLIFTMAFTILIGFNLSKIWRYVAFIAIVVQFIAFYLTGTRGALLGFLCGLCVSALFLAFKSKGLFRKLGVAIILVSISATILFISLRDTSFIQNNYLLQRIADISITQNSRLMVWKTAWEGIKERPLLGYGQENFKYIFNKHYNPKLYGQEEWFDRTHNNLLDILVHSGIVGLLAYLSIFISAIFYIRKLTFKEQTIFYGLLTAYFIQNLFIFDTLATSLPLMALLAYLVPKQELPNVKIKKWAYLGLLFLIFILINLRGMYVANKIVVAILEPNPTHQIQLLRESVHKRNGYLGRKEIREQILLQAIRKPSQELFELVVLEMRKQANENGKDARPIMHFGVFLDVFKNYELSEKYLDLAISLMPNKQTPLIYGSLNALNLGKVEKAKELLKKAYELDTTKEAIETAYLKLLENSEK